MIVNVMKMGQCHKLVTPMVIVFARTMFPGRNAISPKLDIVIFQISKVKNKNYCTRCNLIML